MRHRVAARFLTVPALVAASLAWSLPARADVDGFAVNINKAPGTFIVGKDPLTLTAAVSTDRGGQRCSKVRWQLDIKTDGISIDQLRISRIEDDKPFQVRARVGDEDAQLVDVQLDPGQLCQNQTVSSRWDIAFAGPDDGQVDFTVRALDENGRQLSSDDTTSQVLTAVSATPTDSPTESPSPSATPTDDATTGNDDNASGDDATGQNAATDTPQGAGTSDDAAAAGDLNPTSGTPSVLGPGLIIGAVLVFLGVSLLLRIRTRNRKAAQAELPTGFYTMPRRR
jgi:hypothetical protein